MGHTHHLVDRAGAADSAGTDAADTDSAGRNASRSTTVRTSRRARWATVLLLVGAAVVTAAAMVALWPHAPSVSSVVDRAGAVTGTSASVWGEVVSVGGECAAASPGFATGGHYDGQAHGGQAHGGQAHGELSAACTQARVGVLSGPDAGRLVTVELSGGAERAELRAGDRVQLAMTQPSVPRGDTTLQPAVEPEAHYAVAGVDRTVPLLALGLVFAVVVIAVGRVRGFFALLALGVSGVVIGLFVLPALITGAPGLLIGLVGSTAIMFVTLFFVHGFSMRTAAALMGTLFGLLLVAGISMVAVAATRLSGIGDEAAGFLFGFAGEIDLRGVLSCSILLAGLGVLNDITIAQASSVWELRSAAPQLPRGELYRRAMRIGRDHIASTVYTVVFAYVGAALSVLVLLYLANVPVHELLTREDIAIEVVRTLCGSIGLVLAVPVTTAIAAWLVPADQPLSGFSPRVRHT